MSLTLSLSILFTSHLNCYGRRYMIIIQQLMEPGGQREQSTTGFMQFKDILRHVWPLGCWHTQSNTNAKKKKKQQNIANTRSIQTDKRTLMRAEMFPAYCSEDSLRSVGETHCLEARNCVKHLLPHAARCF